MVLSSNQNALAHLYKAQGTGRGRRRPVPKYEPTPQTTPPELARHYGTDSMDAEMSYSPAYEGGQHEDSAAIPRPLSNAQVMELIAQMDKTLQLDDTDSPAPETTPVTAPVIGHTPRVKVYERVLTLWLNRLGPDGSLINDDPQPPESPTQGLSKM
ncbi:unnamed protein product [Medioppia subpectinata]|uniref:Uncharacterized protein n=1 Tax=Medioppia subpectinata TaxID=1979941 RepID=A0A7R9KU30_9ACAR|nr:unnamed protein product [Medioppia subpectinata]CAG2108694.1 unnamed protein product [Medioppia subpectinata]